MAHNRTDVGGMFECTTHDCLGLNCWHHLGDSEETDEEGPLLD